MIQSAMNILKLVSADFKIGADQLKIDRRGIKSDGEEI